MGDKLNVSVQIEKSFRIPMKNYQYSKIRVRVKNKDLRLTFVSNYKKKKFLLQIK